MLRRHVPYHRRGRRRRLSATRVITVACAGLGLLALPSSVSYLTELMSDDATITTESTGELQPDEGRRPSLPPLLVSVRPAIAGELRSTRVVTPERGTAERSAILAAIRATTGIRNLFRVEHMRVSGDWAYVRCTELEPAEGGLRVTDHEIAALLERSTTRPGQWRVLELWNRGADEAPFARFAERVRAVGREREIPASLFPPSR